MKKSNFWNPELLLRDEIFKNENITGEENFNNFNTFTDISSNLTIIGGNVTYKYAYIKNTLGIFYIRFTPLRENPEINISNYEFITQEIVDKQNIEIIKYKNKISFNNALGGEIAIGGLIIAPTSTDSVQ